MTGSSDPTADFAASIAMKEIPHENILEQFTASKMPRYVCHKKVWALKIAGITLDRDIAKLDGDRETDGSGVITPAEDGYAPFKVDHSYLAKHKPEVGGYYVVYEDGYKSFSPAKAFEDGYARVP